MKSFMLLVLVLLMLCSTSLFLLADGKHVHTMSITPKTKCPCMVPDWCDPITDTKRKEVFAFSVKNDSSHWKQYDWSKVTTLVMVGYHNDELMCLAHGLKRKVSYIASVDIDFKNSSLRRSWTEKQTKYMQEHFFDGINFDYESAIAESDKTTRDAYTSLVAETNVALKRILPYSQVSVDVAFRKNTDGRFYDYVGLANNSDFLFVMSYDEQSQIFGECVSMPNSGFFTTFDGLQSYIDLGITTDKLVLGVPWYGYIYPCVKLQEGKCYLKHVPFRGVNCSDAAGKQYGYTYIQKLSKSSTVMWNATSLTPYYTYMDQNSPTYHQVQFDNLKSLSLKYQMAMKIELRGVGMWHIDYLDYSNTPEGAECRREMFGALPKF